jgi:uroporphyrin-III C-methyltransferase
MSSKSNEILPLIVAMQLEGTPALVVGGGSVATQRVSLLLGAGARPRVVAISVDAKMEEFAERGEITLERRAFRDSDLEGVRMALVAIDSPEESRRIAELARRQRIPINVADVPPLCDFYFCAMHKQGPLQIAVSTNGRGPGLAARIRDELADALPGELEQAIDRFSKVRASLRKLGHSFMKPRMSLLRGLSKRLSWQELAQLTPGEVTLGNLPGSRAPDGAAPPLLTPVAKTKRPKVHLVGAGPGDPDLLTVRALRLLESADLVLADRLIPSPILDLVLGELRVADKSPGKSESSQAQLHRWMIEGAEQGRQVVRLKIGDPFLFGRGGEEVEEMAQHGIDVEVVPGITSALSAPLGAGIPVTMRGEADRITVFTAAGQGGSLPLPPAWHPSTTFIALMGMGALPSLAKTLVRRGFPADLPAACIVNATREDEQRIMAPLSELPEAVRKAGLRPPGVLVFGAVVAVAQAQATPKAEAGSNGVPLLALAGNGGDQAL